MLRGEKVLLRPVRRSDITYFLKWFNDPEVTQYLDGHLPVNEIAEEKHFEEMGGARAKAEAVFIIELIDDHLAKPIGAIDIDEINNQNQSASFWIAVGEKQYWGRGYAKEAVSLIVAYGFAQLNLHRINSSVISFNERSIRMHLRTGFKEEGRQREAVFKNGKYHDLVMYGLLRDEWKASTHR